MADRLVAIEGVARVFGGGRSLFGRVPGVHALRGVTLDVLQGETLAVVGESGCGKSTLARLLVGLDRPTEGRIAFADGTLDGPGRGGVAQHVFQDAVASLNPRRRVRSILEAPLRRVAGLARHDRRTRVDEAVAAVGLSPDVLARYPHELSGGQAQRVGVARALAVRPQLVVLDEPVSSLDVSMQAQLLALLRELRDAYALTYVFVGHDLGVVETISNRVAVMYFGRVAEIGPTRDVFGRPQHPYTRLLIDSAPRPGRPITPAEDDDAALPDPYAPPPGCAFAPRCPRAQEICRHAQPPLVAHDGPAGHRAACHFPLSGD